MIDSAVTIIVYNCIASYSGYSIAIAVDSICKIYLLCQGNRTACKALYDALEAMLYGCYSV